MRDRGRDRHMIAIMILISFCVCGSLDRYLQTGYFAARGGRTGGEECNCLGLIAFLFQLSLPCPHFHCRVIKPLSVCISVVSVPLSLSFMLPSSLSVQLLPPPSLPPVYPDGTDRIIFKRNIIALRHIWAQVEH